MSDPKLERLSESEIAEMEDRDRNDRSNWGPSPGRAFNDRARLLAEVRATRLSAEDVEALTDARDRMLENARGFPPSKVRITRVVAIIDRLIGRSAP